MANLNLSEFTEKLFVADADHTFIWDSAASISKRVSRNSWLNSGTLTSDAPVTISQTWNAGSNVMTALKVVATDTASGATSNLLELWAGSTPALDFAVTKAGAMQAYGTYSSSGANYARLALACDSSGNATISTQALGTGTAGVLAFSPGNSERMRITTAGNVGIGTTAPTASLEIRATAETGVRESLLNCTVSDAGNSVFQIFNGSSNGGIFSPTFGGANFNNNANACLFFAGQTVSAQDSGTTPIVIFQSRITASQTDPNNSSYTSVVNRPLFSWYNTNSVMMQMAANGNLGIGTTSPTSKLHVVGTIKPEQATMVDTALTTLTLASTDAGTIINCTAATAVTVNLPTLDTNAGYNVMIIQSGAGAVTIAANGNTRNSFGSAFTTAGQHAACSIVRTAASTYNLSGNLV